MDLMYIADYSLMKDLRILLMTPKMLFVHDGSEGVVDENEYN
jgi:lipopolysaccharide/colanic/teichoic acid biosynthesis glycosyltransferase